MNSAKRNSVILNLVILIVACSLCLIAIEIGARQILGKLNYLQPYLVADSTLGHAIKPGSGGHDEWGFRNEAVPEKSDIVTIGDSQTYGVSATAEGSWPVSLSRQTRRSVYNLSLGGYGPPQYLILLKEKALKLSPDTVVIGFYFGNDLFDTYRDLTGIRSNTIKLNTIKTSRFFGETRDWLAHNSVFYQASKSFFEKSRNRIVYMEASSIKGVYTFESPNVFSAFEPRARFNVLDQLKDQNRRGLHRTFEIFSEIKSVCRIANIKCWFVLIPTKESVYWPIAKDFVTQEGRQEINKVVDAETVVRGRIVKHFEMNKILYINPLKAMQRGAEKGAIYPSNHDGHPNRNGYNIIAAEVKKAITQSYSR